MEHTHLGMNHHLSRDFHNTHVRRRYDPLPVEDDGFLHRVTEQFLNLIPLRVKHKTAFKTKSFTNQRRDTTP